MDPSTAVTIAWSLVPGMQARRLVRGGNVTGGGGGGGRRRAAGGRRRAAAAQTGGALVQQLVAPSSVCGFEMSALRRLSRTCKRRSGGI